MFAGLRTESSSWPERFSVRLRPRAMDSTDFVRVDFSWLDAICRVMPARSIPLEFRFRRNGISCGTLAVRILRHWTSWVAMLVAQVSRVGSVASVVSCIVAMRAIMAPVTLGTIGVRYDLSFPEYKTSRGGGPFDLH